MKHDLDDIDLAFMTVSAKVTMLFTVLLSRTTGKFYYLNDDLSDDELPDDFETSDDYVEIPDKKRLGLGVSLVHRFIRHAAPKHSDEVYDIFSSRGAYSRFKAFLDRIGLLEAWYQYEHEETNKALRQWCSENSIELKDDRS